MPVVACECSRAAAMSSDKLAARKGRFRQRHDDDDHRLVAGCVPYRVKKDDEGNPKQAEVLMVSTPNRRDMGGWEDDEDVYRSASREAMEEAGVKGVINSSALGHWVFKSKSSQNSNSPRGACKGFIFAMEVTEELESWPEQATHSRRWVYPAEAYQLCRYDWMREALAVLLERLSVIEPVAAAGAAVQELTDQASLYMMLQATSDGAVVPC